MQSTPRGLAVGAGAVALVAAAIIAAAIPSADAGWRFAVMAVAVGLFAAISLDQIALAGVVALASLIYNGFLEDRFGQLAWHGSDDLWRLLLLVTVSAWGLALGEVVRFAANVRARSVEIRGLPSPGGAPRDAMRVNETLVTSGRGDVPPGQDHPHAGP